MFVPSNRDGEVARYRVGAKEAEPSATAQIAERRPAAESTTDSLCHLTSVFGHLK